MRGWRRRRFPPPALPQEPAHRPLWLSLGVLKPSQQPPYFALFDNRERVVNVLLDDESLRRDRLDRTVEQLVSLVHDVRFVVGPLHHGNQPVAALQHSSNR